MKNGWYQLGQQKKKERGKRLPLFAVCYISHQIGNMYWKEKLDSVKLVLKMKWKQDEALKYLNIIGCQLLIFSVEQNLRRKQMFYPLKKDCYVSFNCVVLFDANVSLYFVIGCCGFQTRTQP